MVVPWVLLTMLGYLQPYVILVKGILVRVKALEVAVISGTVICTIHRGILLMTKYDASTGLAFSGCLAALTADWFLFVAFELSLTACQAVVEVSVKRKHQRSCGGWGAAYHPVRDLI